MAAFGVFILALTQTNADIHKETLSYRFFFSVHSQVQNVSENVDKLARPVLNPITKACVEKFIILYNPLFIIKRNK